MSSSSSFKIQSLLSFCLFIQQTSILEPIGSVSPKINIGDRYSVIEGDNGKNLNLLCPAQSYPTPVFR